MQFWPKINILFWYFNIFMPNCLKKTFKLNFDSCLTGVKFLTWLNFQNSLAWPNSNIPEISLDFGMKYSKITYRYAIKLSTHSAPVLKTFHWCIFHLAYLSISPVLWHNCQRVYMLLHLSKACWEIWLSDEQPHCDCSLDCGMKYSKITGMQLNSPLARLLYWKLSIDTYFI